MQRHVIAVITIFAATVGLASERAVSSAEADRLARAAIRAQETGICNVHHIRMQKKSVSIHWGLVTFEEPYYSAELRGFPNAREYVNGGCEFDEREDKKPHWRYVCPECQRVEVAWARAHRSEPEAQSILKPQKT